jgi:POT family proton-dependent oligopeptide transporter
MGINIGAFLGGLLMVWVGKSYSWRAAFALVGVVMIISLINFAMRKKSFGPIGLSPLSPDMPASKRKACGVGHLHRFPGGDPVDPADGDQHGLHGHVHVHRGAAHPGVPRWEMRTFSRAENLKLGCGTVLHLLQHLLLGLLRAERRKLSLFALNNLRPNLFGIPVDPNSVNNAANSLFVIAFSAPAGLLWLWLNKRKLEPNSVVKFGLGFLFLAGGFYIFKSTLGFADANGVTSTEVFTFAWFVITFGELCLSPIGLSLMTKLSPIRIQGLMMGMWFLASA